MRVDQFDFDLPEARIALRPASPRDASRLLEVMPGKPLADRMFTDLADRLRPGDVLVLNDTKVLPAALYGLRPAREHGGGGPAHIEVNLHKRLDGAHWRAFVRPAKRLRLGDVISFGDQNDACMAGELVARIIDKSEGGEVTLGFDYSDAVLDEVLIRVGHMPLPPYIAKKRAVDARDEHDYQTIFARDTGSVAAPTASLHFSDDMFAALDARGVERQTLTLHVGAGTFLPVKTDDTAGHVMHAERYIVSDETASALNSARGQGRRIIAAGTTALRTLESIADEGGVLHAGSDDTDIFITPGYRFRAVDGLLTNFHLPRSTLFMLVCALAGLDEMRAAYAHAIAHDYRFYSYGDASLLWRKDS
jgi:S-adenosylmethionine:tRNA ribosyltransferase-isomerase